MQSPWLTTHSKYIIIYGNNKEIDQTQGTGKGAHEEARRRFRLPLRFNRHGRNPIISTSMLTENAVTSS